MPACDFSRHSAEVRAPARFRLHGDDPVVAVGTVYENVSHDSAVVEVIVNARAGSRTEMC